MLDPGFFSLDLGDFSEPEFIKIAYRGLNGVTSNLTNKRIRGGRAGAETARRECAEEGKDGDTNGSHVSFAAKDECGANLC